MKFKKGHIINLKHGMSKGGEVYTTWQGMKQRCLYKNVKNYKNWGGRGIKICDEWLEFKNFYKDMGDRPKGKTLDRINNDKGYCKENCRWATQKQQNNNKRTNHFLTYKDKTLTVSQWAIKLNINRETIFSRVRCNWNIENILEAEK